VPADVDSFLQVLQILSHLAVQQTAPQLPPKGDFGAGFEGGIIKEPHWISVLLGKYRVDGIRATPSKNTAT